MKKIALIIANVGLVILTLLLVYSIVVNVIEFFNK